MVVSNTLLFALHLAADAAVRGDVQVVNRFVS